MKNIFIIICGLFFSLAHSQEKKVYSFYVQLTHYSEAPEFEKENDIYVYNGHDEKENDFFSKYQILEFSQAFPASRRENNLSIFLVSSTSDDLIDTILKEFPNKYLWAEDITDLEVISTSDYYTDDYGGTSPYANNGVADLLNLDYIDAPKAWGITKGSTDVIIGISEKGKVDILDIDLKDKTTILIPPYYQNLPFDYNDSNTQHGTAVAGIAAAQGDNDYGITGVCPDCKMLVANSGLGNLLDLANAGAKVISMSWVFSGSNQAPQTSNNIIDELHSRNIVLVASSGNENSFDYNSNGLLYYTPASYDHVISVCTVNHKNQFGEETQIISGWGEVSMFVEDMISPGVVTNYQGNGPFGFNSAHTTNDRVDICAPGYKLFRYGVWVGQGTVEYMEWGGTSAASPHVSGTIGLMFSVNECLINDEVEDILQLTSKNLETIQGNEPWVGRSGSGKLETGDAVEFTYEMKQANGNALIDGQDFYRFDFNLAHINNKLTISNQIFRDKCTADFTARNEIEVLLGSDFNPNEYGYVDLKVSDTITIGCSSPRPTMVEKKIANEENQQTAAIAKTKLYPNPNNGTFEITYGNVINNSIEIEVYDIYGKVVYRGTEKTANFTVSIPNLSSGMYIVKLSSGDYIETIKFIKQ